MFKEMKKTILAFTLLLLTILAISIPNIKEVFGVAGNQTSFNVSLTLNNSGPTMGNVPTQRYSPSEGTTRDINVYFNATDSNGVADIPAANAHASINQTSVMRNSTGCTAIGINSTTNQFNCTITINYYDLPGSWNINVSVFDGASAIAFNQTTTLTMGTTYGVSLKTTSLTFSGSPGQQNISASNAPQTINNTGNGAFSNLNLTAFNLVNAGNVSIQLGAQNFSANTTSNAQGEGHVLINNTAVTLQTGSLAVLGTRDVYVYLDIPSGLANGTYASNGSWIVTMW